jgi:hypothetical protein
MIRRPKAASLADLFFDRAERRKHCISQVATYQIKPYLIGDERMQHALWKFGGGSKALKIRGRRNMLSASAYDAVAVRPINSGSGDEQSLGAQPVPRFDNGKLHLSLTGMIRIVLRRHAMHHHDAVHADNAVLHIGFSGL